ncbi:MAG TPA: hypothetical protein VMS17_05720 [Gemmataceae bacterium]|nr:hypothetical protein [Gemmataceae bacterium]
MRRLFLAFAVGGVLLGSSGCFVNEYSSNPNTRMVELLNQSEDLRQLAEEWERFWMIDHPSHMSYDRVDGALE